MRRGLYSGLALVVLALLLPTINVGGFANRFKDVLEVYLGRKIEFEKAHLVIFPVPGFSLENVTIDENPGFGIEPFAYMGTLHARLRIDKLLLGQLRLGNLKFVEPSLNLVKRADGQWNVVELAQRLSAPRRAPLNFFPAVQISQGRVDVKFGTRKTMLYISESDLSIYPERSGKLYMQFSGSPARTDRAGNGFGHLRGSATWLIKPNSQTDQVDASITLDPSNLSELTTLLQGHDVGVHGTISAHARLHGPTAALAINGDLHLEDVHRWDLLPASGEDWWIGYKGRIDLLAHELNLTTTPLQAHDPTPVGLQLRVNHFLARPAWSIIARFDQAPVQRLLPLGKRMGLPLPDGLSLAGTLNGVIGYSNNSGLAGGVTLAEAIATLPDAAPLRASSVSFKILPDAVHIEPTEVQTGADGSLQVEGEYNIASRQATASFEVRQLPVKALKSTVRAWFGAPAVLGEIDDGILTGNFLYRHPQDLASEVQLPDWAGQFQFTNATLTPDALSLPLTRAQGHVVFDPQSLDLTRLSAHIGERTLVGNYHYNLRAKRPERLRVEMPAADLSEVESALDATLRPQSLLARLRVTKREIPSWLAARNLDADLVVAKFSASHVEVGELTSHFVLEGANVNLSSLRIRLPQGRIQAEGGVDLASYAPRLHLRGTLQGFPWGGGVLQADGELQTTGLAEESVRNLRAAGTFAASHVRLPSADPFDTVTGKFDLSFPANAPDLRLSNIVATQADREWEGEGTRRTDGTLAIDLEHEDRQLHLVGPLLAQPGVAETQPVKSPQQ